VKSTAVRLRILSDLHVEFALCALNPVDADVVIVAGDVHPGRTSLKWILNTFPNETVLFVLGNHEFYGHALPKLADDLKAQTAGTKVHVLDNDGVILNGVRFLGTTLWTDFKLRGNPADAGALAAAKMTDYRRIRVSPRYSRLKGLDTARLHARSCQWLQDQFEQSSTEPTVVITHHAPSERSLRPVFLNDELSPAYASHLDDLVAASGAKLWIHGHTHTATDYRIGETRVLSNQRGYPDDPAPGFQPDLVVEI
jgi:predicted phosphodiesterase